MNRLSFSIQAVKKIAIVAGLIVAVALVGWMASQVRQTEMMLVMCLVPLAVLIVPRLSKMEYGVLAILLAAGFVRLTISTGTQSDLVASLLVAAGVVALWIANMLIVDKRIRLKPVQTNVPLLGFMSVCVISYAWSNAFRDVLVATWGTFPFVQLAALVVMLLLPAVFLLVSNCIEDVKWLKAMSGIVIVIGAVTVPYHVFPIGVGRAFVLHLFQAGRMGIFPLWGVSITYALVLLNRRMSVWLRLLLLSLGGMWMYTLIGHSMAWLSAWMPPLCAILVIAYLRSKRLFLVMVLIGLVYGVARFEYLYDRIYLDSVTEGDAERLDLWRTNLELVKDHLVFGTGPAGYAVYYMAYHPENARSTHNNYFDIVAQTGIVGFSLFLWFFGALAYTGYELCRKLRGQRGFEEAYACAMTGGCVGAIVAMMLGDWVVPFVYNVGVRGFDHAVYAWLLMGGMVALHHIVGGRIDEGEIPEIVSDGGL